MTPQWILRKGTKRSGFRYVTAAGKAAPESARARAAALVIPPAWTDVHIAASPTAAVQAWGFDAKGRKQYRYHDRAAERGQLRKFYRVRQMARDLPAIREAVARDFRTKGLTKRRVAAGVVRLIGEAYFRVGSDRYAEQNKTFGIATLRKKHAAVHADGASEERVVFDYVGKESVRQHQVIFEPALVAFVRELLDTPGPRLFRYQSTGDDGRPHWHDLTSRDVNEYMHDVLGVPYSAKDFRTWGGTLRLATILADLGPGRTARETQKNLVVALRLVASDLGNTPTVCRKAYIHPIVIARYLDEGSTIAPFLSRAVVRRATARAAAHGRGHEGHPPEERALIGFLDKYFPERRGKRRDRRRRDREQAGERRAARAVADAA
ncbi:topoisomerase I [Gemmatimonadetes bacterium T265]|nr:topoisomerase I [Gemmatimonadetes bacterium T265]